ncbi:MAG TPA: glycosyltransferase family 4 protein [Longimicrobiales bacterium]
MRRVALLLESDGPGGAEMMVLQLAEELRRRGHSICFIGPANGCGWLGGEFRKAGFDTESFSLRRPLDLGCLRDLVRIFRQRSIEVAHCHEFTMAVYGTAAARVTRIGSVVTMHGGKHALGARRRRMALRWAFRHSGGVVAVSEASRAELLATLGEPRGGIHVVRNGIRFVPGAHGDGVRRELGATHDESVIVAVGNLYPVKGHLVLLKALAVLRELHPELKWRLAIAGTDGFGGTAGGEGPALRRFAEEHGLSDRLHLLGFRTDVPDLLAAADIFAMPSLSEGLPMAMLEAMFAGKAIVASAVGGIPEVITHEEEGLLVPPGDPDGLATALARLLRDEALRRAIGNEARRRAEEAFSIEAMANEYERAYRVARERTIRPRRGALSSAVNR